MSGDMIGQVPVDDVRGLVGDIIGKLAGREGPTFAAEFKKFVLKQPCWVKGLLAVISIDRTRPFNPASLIGDGWTIWRGPANGKGLEGEEEQDARSLAITEVDLSKVVLETKLKDDESVTTGEERLKRLAKSGEIRLDAAVFQYLWENKHLVPEEWKGKAVFFDGTVLRSPSGERYALYLCWNGNAWNWNADWLDDGRYASYPSACLASQA